MDGFKSAFLGGFGIDYYAKKSAETLAEVRDDGRPYDVRLSADELNYIGFLGTVAKTVEPLVIVDLDAAVRTNARAVWGVRAVPLLNRAIEMINAAGEPPGQTLLVKLPYRDALRCYVLAAEARVAGLNSEGDAQAQKGAANWERAIDAAQLIAGT